MADLEKYKLSSLFWEGDKNGEGFFVYLENFGSMVRATYTYTASGHHLEDMLDSKLRQRRASILKGSVPSCLLLDPDFATFPPPVLETLASDEVEGQAPSEVAAEDGSASVNVTVASAAVGSANTGSTFTLGTHSVSYKDLP